MFIAFIGAIDDSVTQPIIWDAFLITSTALEIVFVAAAVLFIREVTAIGFPIAQEVFADALLLVFALERGIITSDVAIELVAEVEAVEFTVASEEWREIFKFFKGNFELIKKFWQSRWNLSKFSQFFKFASKINLNYLNESLIHRPSSHLNSVSVQFFGGQFSSSDKSLQSATLSHFQRPGMHFPVELHLKNIFI